MEYFLSSLLSFILLYKYYALFLIVFSAAIIVPWPQNTLLLATGAFASQGYFGLAATFTVALVANVLGDAVDYLFTYRWGSRFIKEQHLKKFAYIDRLNRYVKKHAGLTILITRFFGTFGSMVNFISGLIGVPFKKFLVFDILGNALDIGLFLIAGYLLGSLWQNFSEITETAVWILLIAFLLNIVVNVFWKPTRVSNS